MMMRIFIGFGVLFAALLGMVSSFLDRTGVSDWAERLNSPQTFTIVATSTTPIPLEPQTVFHTASGVPKDSLGEEAIPPDKVTSRSEVKPPATRATTAGVSQEKTSAATLSKQAQVSSLGIINEKAIIDLTNVERVREGRSSLLVWNEKLSLMAYQKAKDMLERQYFAHESPDGKSVGDLAEGVGYAYRFVGENLAVGDFRTNEELIAGWMGSPGHRVNMLKEDYTEMGAAAIEGVFEGNRVWMAVQEFGKPFPLCEKPNQGEKEEIARINMELASLDESIVVARSAIESSTEENVRAQKITDYNILIEVYNTLVPKLKALISSYNDGVRAYNACLEQ